MRRTLWNLAIGIVVAASTGALGAALFGPVVGSIAAVVAAAHYNREIEMLGGW